MANKFIEAEERLREAAKDLRFLLRRRYNKETALRFVGDKYQLNKRERWILYRSIQYPEYAKKILKKKIKLDGVSGKILAIDGYNVLITVECVLKGEPLILGDDGFLRDIAGVFGKYRISSMTNKALRLILDEVRSFSPKKVLFVYDQPVSRSGELAQRTREIINEMGINGDAMTLKRTDKTIASLGEVVASSDLPLLLMARAVVDLPAALDIEKFIIVL